jgi:hypothetical protein
MEESITYGEYKGLDEQYASKTGEDGDTSIVELADMSQEEKDQLISLMKE